MGEAWRGLKMLSKNTCDGVHLIVKLLVISLQACKFIKNEFLHTYFWRILARFKLLFIVLFPEIISWKGTLRFSGEVCFSDGGELHFYVGVRPVGIGFDGRGFNKNRWMRGAPPMLPTMGNPAPGNQFFVFPLFKIWGWKLSPPSRKGEQILWLSGGISRNAGSDPWYLSVFSWSLTIKKFQQFYNFL